MSVRLVVSMKALPGKGDEWAADFLPRTLETQKEPGCLQYELHRSMQNLDHFTLLERWSDPEALEVHMGVLRARPRPTGPSLTEGPPTMERYED